MKRVFLLCLSVVLLMGLAACGAEEKAEKSHSFPITVTDSELLCESAEEANTVRVYGQRKRLVINATSTDLFAGVQFTVDTEQTMTEENIEVKWVPTGDADGKKRMAVIIVTEGEKTICCKSVDFRKEPREAVKDVM